MQRNASAAAFVPLTRRTLFVLAQGSLLTDLASPTPLPSPHSSPLPAAQQKQQQQQPICNTSKCDGAAVASNSTPPLVAWREVDFLTIHIDPRLEPGNPLSVPELCGEERAEEEKFRRARPLTREQAAAEEAGRAVAEATALARQEAKKMKMAEEEERRKAAASGRPDSTRDAASAALPPSKPPKQKPRGKKPTTGLSLDPPPHLPSAITTRFGTTPPPGGCGGEDAHHTAFLEAAALLESPLWGPHVARAFVPGHTIYDVTDSSLRTQLELVALNGNLTPLDCLSSPIMALGDSRYAPLFAELRSDVLPRLVVADSVSAALTRAGGIMRSEAPLIRKGRQIAGRNVALELIPIPSASLSSLARVGKEEGKTKKEEQHVAAAKAVLMRCKGFCFGVWTVLRAMLHTLPPSERPAEEAEAGSVGAESHWRNNFTLAGLLTRMADSPTVGPSLRAVSIDAIVRRSEELSAAAGPAAAPLQREAVIAAAQELLRRQRIAAAAASRVDDDAGSNDAVIGDAFPFVLFVESVVAVRRARGYASSEESALTPPLFCDLFLCSLMSAFTDQMATLLRAAVERGTIRDVPEVPPEDVAAMDAFLAKAAAIVASTL